jgi:hypothetical protein
VGSKESGFIPAKPSKAAGDYFAAIDLGASHAKREPEFFDVGGWGTFFTFSYFACRVGLTMIGALHAKTATIRHAGGVASYYCQGERKTKNL